MFCLNESKTGQRTFMQHNKTKKERNYCFSTNALAFHHNVSCAQVLSSLLIWRLWSCSIHGQRKALMSNISDEPVNKSCKGMLQNLKNRRYLKCFPRFHYVIITELDGNNDLEKKPGLRSNYYAWSSGASCNPYSCRVSRFWNIVSINQNSGI